MAFLSIATFTHVMLTETSLRPPWLLGGQWPCASRRNLLVQGVPREFKAVAMDGLTIILWYEYVGGGGGEAGRVWTWICAEADASWQQEKSILSKLHVPLLYHRDYTEVLL